MKILFVGVFNKNSTNVSQSRGFKENGSEVYEYDYRTRLSSLKNIKRRDDELINLTHSLKPDLVIFSKCNQMHYRVVDDINKVSKTCMWYMDAMHNFDNELVEKSKRVNYFISGVEGVTPYAKKFCNNTLFVHQCPDDAMNFMLDNINYKDDITFIGSVDSSKIHGDRQMYVNTLNNEFSGFKHYTGIFGLEHNKIVNESKINLNFSPTDATGVSVRIYKILASGGFLMTTPWKGLEETFTSNENIVTFETKEELIEKAKFYLENEEERNRIRLNSYNKVQEFLPKQWGKRIIEFCKL